ncbi:hypothetical protein EB796_000782 [Bugula neritina]|uniref:Calponin-homology (CH) domain-containing protein n=1 Tax=Bugula neritina TaxID=10212 RepID=A0A7J7KRX4_BUGNE|nr:hypothetical protein EB796_000782 [Bugula neritina]
MAEEEPLPSPPLLQDKWVTIQKNTFTNFVNQQLRETEHQIEELYTELSDGVKLCALVAALQGKPGIRGMKPESKK